MKQLLGLKSMLFLAVVTLYVLGWHVEPPELSGQVKSTIIAAIVISFVLIRFAARHALRALGLATAR